MENPEEVLQALDEFQKMRPTEIPRELEEYLCWVAKTGDPVYQWSLIKALFREKLTRVMTDFHESCPSLDLAPCPNVETFNYDTMKSSLLERLESFANAPFTVQRICELLTAPRKEYNRVDKFMRAIEKNILVVSTKEPGSTLRRSENGDGLVNGSMEDEVPGDAAHDVEMDSWVKDCATSTMDAETRLLDDVTTNFPKSSPVANGGNLLAPEKPEHSAVSICEAGLNFVPSTSEFSGHALEGRESLGAQGLATSVVHETPSIAREVPDAIMNEDTSSQPSLDIDSPESEPADPNRKLQTTFQAKDFITHEKSPEPYEDTKVTAQADPALEAINDIPPVEDSSKSPDECAKPDLNERASILPNMENFLHTRLENSVITSEGTPDQPSAPEIEENASPKEEKDLVPEISTCQEQSSNSNSSESFTEENPPQNEAEEICAPKEAESEIMNTEPVQQEAQPSDLIVDETREESTNPVTDTPEKVTEETSNPEKPEISSEEEKTIEESTSEKCDSNDDSQHSENSSLTIEETTEDDSSEAKSIVPDPIPIVEEPKEEFVEKSGDTETSIEEIDSKTSPAEAEDLPKNEPTIIETLENSDDATSSQVPPPRTCEETKTDAENSSEIEQVPDAPIAEIVPEKVETKPEESMEVDGETTAAAAAAATLQQDEPMEEETQQVAS